MNKPSNIAILYSSTKNSFSPEFLSAVSPKYSIISAGKNNRYGHPHKEIIDFLNNIKSQILITYNIGDIYFISDGTMIIQQ